MTETTSPSLSLQLSAGEDVVIADFVGFDGGPMRNREKRALRAALEDAISALNVRRARSIRPRLARPGHADGR